MLPYTVQDPFGARVTVRAAGPESAKVLARYALNLHQRWPVVVARYPDPPGLSGKVLVHCNFLSTRKVA